MILLPAVDILGGKAVRLTRGSFDAQTVYDEDPVEAALGWVKDGARALHVVDLDGARAGTPVNLGHVERIVCDTGVPVQVGGGLRRLGDIERVVQTGAARIVIGTAAFRDERLLADAVDRFGGRVVVSLDARAGRVATSGWLEQTELSVDAAIERLESRGVARFVYSSIDHDGTLHGPDLEAIDRLSGAIRGSFVYSGGISSLDDLRAVNCLGRTNLEGVIVGKALYEQRFSVGQGQAALEREGSGACITSG